MTTLQENQCYGLSSGKLNRGGNVSVFHVKLTDSAARAIGSFQNGKGVSSHPTICFNGNQGRISIPCLENREELRNFSFDVTKVACENPHGSFDCVQQLDTGTATELSCLGVIQKKMKVRATDDSYDKVRQSMALAVEETLSHGAIVIKQEGLSKGKKVKVRAPAPALASLTKPRPSVLNNIKRGVGIIKGKKGACVSGRKSLADMQERPLRERVTHLLALRPYRRPDLMLRLQKDGLTAGDKGLLGPMLTEVGQLHSKDNTYVLKDSLFKELQKDWPGYTSGDQQLLKRILVRRLFKPQQNLLTVPEAQVSPLRETPNSSPAHRPKPLLPLSVSEDYTDPLASKKPRISHFSNKTAKSRVRLSERAARKEEAPEAMTVNEERRDSLDPRKLFDSLSAACQREAEAAKRLEPPRCAQEEAQGAAAEDRPQPNCEHPPSPLTVPHLNRHTLKRKRNNKHQDKEKDRFRDRKERKKDHKSEDPNDNVSLDFTEPSESLFDSKVLPEGKDSKDYLLTYAGIRSHDQRQRFKLDFNREYSEYRDLHARIDGVTRQFMELDTQLKRLHRKSHKYKTVHNQILQEYRKIKKSNPNFNQDRSRCEYLHNKLAHIKKIISAYDQQQLGAGHPLKSLTTDH